MQKVDGVADGFTGSGQQTGTSAEQTIIAQSQHHQQFLGMKACFILLYKLDDLHCRYQVTGIISNVIMSSLQFLLTTAEKGT